MLSNCGAGEDIEIPLEERRSNQSILKEINPEYSLEGWMLKLKLQYFYYVMWKANWLVKTLILGKIEGKRKRRWQGIKWLDSITDSMNIIWANSGRWWRTEKPGMVQSMVLQKVGCDLMIEQQFFSQFLGEYCVHINLLNN